MTLSKETHFFWTRLCSLRRDSAITLQAQLREAIVQAILEKRLLPGASLPATRGLAQALSVSRNTVLQAYASLVKEGYLNSHSRSGHAVASDLSADAAHAYAVRPLEQLPKLDWRTRVHSTLTTLPQLQKPHDWQSYPYPFVYGQFDSSLFPASAWREANQMAMRKMTVRDWAGDSVDRDDPLLISQIQARLLRRRGISVSSDEILVTLGAQHAMFLFSAWISRHARCIGIEEPGYLDLRNLFRFFSVPARALPFAEDASNWIDGVAGCDYVFVSPSHQNPTCRTMSLEERVKLLEAAARYDFIIVEDDYDSELSFQGDATPSIRALDTSGRVIYIGSLSKTIAAGLRIGYLVAPVHVIAELRALRRLMLRHPPANNQRAVALFLSLGHYDALLPRLIKAYRERAQVLCHALERHLPQSVFSPPRGGSAIWVRAPEGTDMRRVRDRARAEGVLFDAGADFFSSSNPPLNYFRLGYSSIGLHHIEPGISKLAGCMRSESVQNTEPRHTGRKRR